jgi:prepilin-type N-terminal cleavage/methylation domain-containing protein
LSTAILAKIAHFFGHILQYIYGFTGIRRATGSPAPAHFPPAQHNLSATQTPPTRRRALSLFNADVRESQRRPDSRLDGARRAGRIFVSAKLSTNNTANKRNKPFFFFHTFLRRCSMCKFNSKMGFTLIELMVVIVIIGVLASLAIPRFTEASDKAKAAEAPRILASYESAQLAYIAETGGVGGSADLIFNVTAANSDSKWWGYGISGGSCTAQPSGKAIGKIATTDGLSLNVAVSANEEGGVKVTRTAIGNSATMVKYVPNFFK